MNILTSRTHPHPNGSIRARGPESAKAHTAEAELDVSESRIRDVVDTAFDAGIVVGPLAGAAASYFAATQGGVVATAAACLALASGGALVSSALTESALKHAHKDSQWSTVRTAVPFGAALGVVAGLAFAHHIPPGLAAIAGAIGGFGAAGLGVIEVNYQRELADARRA